MVPDGTRSERKVARRACEAKMVQNGTRSDKKMEMKARDDKMLRNVVFSLVLHGFADQN